MNYKLAKQLKDAGFPQGVICPHGEDTMCPCQEEFEAGKQTEAYPPTLEEVIEELGDKVWNNHILTLYCGKWMIGVRKKELALEIDSWIVDGKTPLEAVSNLYIKLNK